MRSVLSYLVLVGGPFLLLLGILEVGAGLTPPRSIAGAWTIVPPLEGEVGRCLRAPAKLEISQSGVRAEALLGEGRAQMPVALNGDSLIGAAAVAAEGACPGGRLVLAARLDGDAPIPSSMTGVLALPGCRSCAPMAFRATRQTPERTAP